MESAVETIPCDCEEVDVDDVAAAAVVVDDADDNCSSSRPFCFFSNTSNSTAVNPESDCTMQAFSPSIEVRASRARHPLLLLLKATTDEDDDVALASFPPAPPTISPLVAVVAATTLSCSAEAAAVMRFRFVDDELLVGQ